MSDERDKPEDSTVPASSRQEPKTAPAPTVQLELDDDDDCTSFNNWWKAEGKRIYKSWKSTR